jgi:hypothetical protein
LIHSWLLHGIAHGQNLWLADLVPGCASGLSAPSTATCRILWSGHSYLSLCLGQSRATSCAAPGSERSTQRTLLSACAGPGPRSRRIGQRPVRLRRGSLRQARWRDGVPPENMKHPRVGNEQVVRDDPAPARVGRRAPRSYAIRNSDNDPGSVSRSYCGFVRKRGTVRTSTTRPISEAASKSMNSPIGYVEWPMVKNGNAMPATTASNSRPAVSRGLSTRRPYARRHDRFYRS